MKARVKVFSAPHCGYCTMMKAYLKERKVSFEEVDISTDPQAAAWLREATGGQVGVPVTFVDEKEFVFGFDRAQIDSLLDAHKL